MFSIITNLIRSGFWYVFEMYIGKGYGMDHESYSIFIQFSKVIFTSIVGKPDYTQI